MRSGKGESIVPVLMVMWHPRSGALKRACSAEARREPKPVGTTGPMFKYSSSWTMPPSFTGASSRFMYRIPIRATRLYPQRFFHVVHSRTKFARNSSHPTYGARREIKNWRGPKIRISRAFSDVRLKPENSERVETLGSTPFVPCWSTIISMLDSRSPRGYRFARS